VYKGEYNLVIKLNFKCNGKIRLIVRLTSQTRTKVGHSDPVILRGKIIAQRIKGTPGITGL